MGKWWAVLFGVVMAACAGLFVVAPMVPGWWLPEGVSSHAHLVDNLFYFILAVTAFFFFLTEFLLVLFIWKYAERGPVPAEEAPAAPSRFGRYLGPVRNLLNDQHKVEMAWTLVPALILLYLAFAQIGAWVKIKYQSRMWEEIRSQSQTTGLASKDFALQVDVSARQFEWRMRYATPERVRSWMSKLEEKDVKTDFNSFRTIPQRSDVHVVNEIHTWVGQPVLVHLSTRDVLHSFNIPAMRVKQDALPGKQIPVWFTPTKVNVRFDPKTKTWVDGIDPATGKHDARFIWDIACAELCGWGHYRMIGRVFVHPTREDFLAWLEKAEAAGNARK